MRINDLDKSKIKYSIIFLFTIVFVFILFSVFASGINVPQCQTLNTQSSFYSLNQSISSDLTCINITANNIILEGNGFNVTYGLTNTNAVYGIYVNASNVTIRNITVYEGVITTSTNRHGIYFNQSHNGTVFNTSVIVRSGGNNPVSYGIFFDNASQGNVSRSSIELQKGGSFAGDGIRISTGFGYFIFANNITINGSSSSGISFSTVNDSIVQANSIVSKNGEGLTLSPASGNKFINNNITAEGSNGDGYAISSSYHNVFMGDIIRTTSTGEGIFFSGSVSNLTFYNITVITEAADGDGINLGGSNINASFFDSSINASSINANDTTFSTGSSGTVNFTNLTLINDRISFAGTTKVLLNTHWYVEAFANFTNGTGASNSNISAYNASGTLFFSVLTNGSGYIARQTVLSVIRNASDTFDYNNFTFNATHSLAFANQSQSWNLTTNRDLRFTFNSDITSPIVTINFPANRTYGNSSLPLNFNVSLNENGSVIYSLNNGRNNFTMTGNQHPFGTAFNATNNSIAEGSYIFSVYANDTTGNRNYTHSITFSLDTTLPTVNVIDPSGTYTSLPVVFNISTNENSTAFYTLNGGRNNFSMTANVSSTGFTASNNSIANGDYVANFYVNDSVGNKNYTMNASFTISVSSGGGGGSSGGGGGGGGGTGVGIGSSVRVGTFEVGVNTIERTINVGEEVFENILLRNTDDRENIITVLIDELLVGIVSVNNRLEIPPSDSKQVLIRIFGASEGVYEGNIYFFGRKITTKIVNQIESNETGLNTSIVTGVEVVNTTYVLPVKVTVRNLPDKDVDLSIVLDRTVASQGQSLDFEVRASNLGRLTSYDIELIYEIFGRGNNTFLISRNEVVKIESSVSLERSIVIPNSFSDGDYELVVTARYGNETTTARESFRVGEERFSLSPILDKLRSINLGGYFVYILAYLPLILFVLFIVILSIIGVYYFTFLRKKLFEKKIEEIKKNSIYVFPDFNLLPKSHFAYIGQVADSGVKTYLDHTQLNRHTLIAGGTGSGKTVAGMVVVEEILKKGGYPVLVFDPVGQWTGFSEKNKDKSMISRYKKFGISGARAFDTKIIEINDKNKMLDILYYLKRSGLTVFKLDKLHPKDLDEFIEYSLEIIYRANLSETGSLKALIVLDEVHRLLPKYGGKKAHIKLEQAVREFRKWGIGLLMISQVLTDFKGSIRGNIGTEIQLRTRYEGDIKRVKERHGSKISNLMAKLPTGLVMVECSDYNKGNPYFVEFRPLLHSPYKVDSKLMHKIVEEKNVILEQKEIKKEEKELKPGGIHKIGEHHSARDRLAKRKRERIIDKLRRHRTKIAQKRELRRHARKYGII